MRNMINTEFFRLGNLFTLSIIILAWIFIHEKVVKNHIVKDGD